MENTEGNLTVIKRQLFVIKKWLGYKAFHKITQTDNNINETDTDIILYHIIS